MDWKLPEILRPRNVSYRKLAPGIDFPGWFLDGLKGLDQNLYLVWHPFNLLWDPVMNEYAGALEEPRHTIYPEGQHLCFGFVPDDGKGQPILRNRWHLWRLSWPFGWTHVTELEDNSEVYLRFVLKRLWQTDRLLRVYGAHAFGEAMRAEDEQNREKQIQEQEQNLFDWQKENKWLVRSAMDNLGRGKVKPTKPMKDIITSAAGISHRSRIIRPVTDKEAGIVNPFDN